MNFDFTIITYKRLLNTLSDQGFSFLTFGESCSSPTKKIVVLRHDVDKLPQSSLEFAKIQTDRGIRGAYYFRMVKQSFDEKIIKEIYSMGHEVGYHYEDFSFIAERQKTKGERQKYESQEDYERYLAELAIESFTVNLEKLRKIVPVKTICMHGSPMSRWDSRLLWKYYDYRDFGILGEPYFDVNFNEVLYLTDTGRQWDGDSYNMRDKATGDRLQAFGEEKKGGVGSKKYEVGSKEFEKSVNFSRENHPALSTQYPAPFPEFHSTFDIIKAAVGGLLSDKIMMTFHPQRWTDKPGPWVKEFVWQNVKNAGKYFLIKGRREQ